MRRARLGRFCAAMAILAVGLAIAGCGGGDEGGAGATTPATQSAAEYRAAADAICAKADAAIDALPGRDDRADAHSAQDAAAEQLASLRALRPPADLKPAHDAALGLLAQQQALIEGAVAALDGGASLADAFGRVTSQLDALSTQADARAKELGLAVCGRDTESGTATTTATAPPATSGASATPEEYLADVQRAAGALTSFGDAASGATSPATLQAAIPDLRAALSTFDDAIAKLGGYTVPNARVEAQRAGLVSSGPGVSDALGKFVDAIEAGDAAAIVRLGPPALAALSAFEQAALAPVQ